MILAKAAAWARAKPNSAKADAAFEELLRVRLGEAGAHGAAHEAVALRLHLLVAAVGSHGLAEDVRLDRGVAADGDGDLHHLLLVEDHAQGVGQDRRQAGVEVGHRLLSGAPAKVGMDRVALDGAGPDDRDLDHEVLEALRPCLGERLHLGPGLDLEDAHRVGAADGGEDLRIVVGEAVEVRTLPGVALDPVEDVGDHAQGPQGEEVDLHQAQRLHVLLVELRYHPSGHAGALDGDQVDERSSRDEHAAHVDAEVAREAVDLRAERQQPLPPVARCGVESRGSVAAVVPVPVAPIAPNVRLSGLRRVGERIRDLDTQIYRGFRADIGLRAGYGGA